MGGYDGTNMVPTVEVFDPRIGSWMTGESMNDPRGYSGAVVLGESIYVIGGLKDNEEILDTVITSTFKKKKKKKVKLPSGRDCICFYSTF